MRITTFPLCIKCQGSATKLRVFTGKKKYQCGMCGEETLKLAYCCDDNDIIRFLAFLACNQKAYLKFLHMLMKQGHKEAKNLIAEQMR